jgi:leucine efflux protein
MQAIFHALGITDVWQLVVATMVFLMLPGPGTFCILSCAAKRGWRGGFTALVGLLLGDIILMSLAALGVAALLHANPMLFKGVQYIGAAYLAYLGVRLLFAKDGDGDVAAPFSQLEDFRRGLFVTLINPKAIVFYMAFFPLFIDPITQQGSLTFVMVGSVICLCTMLYGSLLVLAGNMAAKCLAHNRLITTIASRAAGVFLIGFGIKLTTN